MRVLALLVCTSTGLGSALGWHLNLLHVNDIHVRIEQTNKYSARCRLQDKERGRCYGGLARLQTAVQELRNSKNNTLWVNAGDFFQGTVWYSHFKWKIVSHFNKLLDFDAMCLGNHEFDDGIEGLEPFLRENTCPILAANLDISREPILSGLFQPSIIVAVGGRKVGIVGYTTPETLEVSNPGRVGILDEVETVRAEVTKLVEDGVDIIVALGHSGYYKDMEIAKEIPEIDIIVGGHTHSFLYTDKEANPSVESIKGPYPTMINNRTLVVQAYAYTKYLGNLQVEFSEDGRIESWQGAPILLDSSYKEDELILKELKPWKLVLDKIGRDLIGAAAEVLFRSREAESNIGNLVTDAMVWAHRDKDLQLALVNSGGIRASFDRGKITMGDLLNSFPFRNTFDLVVLRGETLRKIFEHSVGHMTRNGRNTSGRFLQVSGFRLHFDLMRPEMSRLVLAEVACPDCPMQWEPLQDSREYTVVVTNYLAGGGDGFSIIPQEAIRHLQGPLDTDILKEYIKLRSPLRNKVEGRIQVKTSFPTTPIDFPNSLQIQNSSYREETSCAMMCRDQLYHLILVFIISALSALIHSQA